MGGCSRWTQHYVPCRPGTTEPPHNAMAVSFSGVHRCRSHWVDSSKRTHQFAQLRPLMCASVPHSDAFGNSAMAERAMRISLHESCRHSLVGSSTLQHSHMQTDWPRYLLHVLPFPIMASAPDAGFQYEVERFIRSWCHMDHTNAAHCPILCSHMGVYSL